ncbi:VOC family protein [Heyndrickxia sp. NPDC080065]|uniref:VOC family protein n=1 Tax=Heyndrickxia sp. NPDC080065 TaxID=3390568 RepID=UPI003CFF3A56
MKIDHIVINVDSYIQTNKEFIDKVDTFGIPYKPKWGKGTKGFKVSNLWIGKEYLEMVRIKTFDGGGWISNWTKHYHHGHRGVIGLALEVDNIEEVFHELNSKGVNVTPPKPLTFKWFFKLLSKTMPWRNSYLPEFEGFPFQIFLQQLNDEKSKAFMQQYMVPNSTENHINGIKEIKVYGKLTINDKNIIRALFQNYEEHEKSMIILLGQQTISFIEADEQYTEILLDCNNKDYSNKHLDIHNVLLINS